MRENVKNDSMKGEVVLPNVVRCVVYVQHAPSVHYQAQHLATAKVQVVCEWLRQNVGAIFSGRDMNDTEGAGGDVTPNEMIFDVDVFHL